MADHNEDLVFLFLTVEHGIGMRAEESALRDLKEKAIEMGSTAVRWKINEEKRNLLMDASQVVFRGKMRC